MLKKGEIKMIKKLIKNALSKSEIARRLGISRETVRKYDNKPDNYIPIINRTPIKNIVDHIFPNSNNT